MMAQKHVPICILLMASLVQVACNGPVASPTEGPPTQAKDSYRGQFCASLGLEASHEIYQFVRCKGRLSSFLDILPPGSICDISIKYDNGVLKECRSQIYEFHGQDSIRRVLRSPWLEQLFIEEKPLFQLVEGGNGTYSFWLNADTNLSTMECASSVH